MQILSLPPPLSFSPVFVIFSFSELQLTCPDLSSTQTPLLGKETDLERKLSTITQACSGGEKRGGIKCKYGIEK